MYSSLIANVAIEHWHDAVRDARHAARLLARAPGFTVAAVLGLAIGRA